MEKSFLKDFSWYFLGSVIPIIIGIIKTPIFTRHFNQTDFGYFGIISVTFSFLSMILFSWISSCIWRFHPKYNAEKKLNELYTNLTFLFFVTFLILLTVSIIWYILENNVLMKQLIVYSFIHLLFNQLYLFYIIIIRQEGRAVFYTVFQSIRAVLSLIIVLTLVFVFEVNITALISSLIIVDFFAVLFLILINPSKISIKLKLIHEKYLKDLIIYGSTGLLINVCFLIISTSDRYIIAWLGDIKDVGVYDQVYKISQLSVTALVTIFFNTINPTLLNKLELHFENSKYLIRLYLKFFILYGFPLIIYLSIFSKDIAFILLGKEFRVGYSIMPFVFIAAYLHGISNFYELRLKFTNKLKKISLIMIAATFLNVLLTILFVWLYGYKWAAITTVITYIIVLMTFHYFDDELVQFSKKKIKFTFKFLIVLSFELVIFIFINKYFNLSLLYKLLLSLICVIIYIIIFKNQFKNLKLPVNY